MNLILPHLIAAHRYFEIDMPVPPARGNFRGHTIFTSQHHQWKKQARKYTDYFYLQNKKHFPLEAAWWYAHVEVYNPYDECALIELMKWPHDLLVEDGILVNDDYTRLHMKCAPTQEVNQIDQRMFKLFLIPTERFSYPTVVYRKPIPRKTYLTQEKKNEQRSRSSGAKTSLDFLQRARAPRFGKASSRSLFRSIRTSK